MTSSIDHRRDVRPIETFGHNIKDYTEREHHWSKALHLDFEQRGLICELSDYGVDGTGELILDKLTNYNADKKYHILKLEKELLVEIKTAPEYLNGFFTFKVFCLRECVSEGAWICVPAAGIERRPSGYFLFKPAALEIMLDKKKYVQRKYWNETTNKGFSPNDIAVRIPMGHIQQMVDDKLAIWRDWMPKAKRYIQEHLDILTREKKV